MDLDQYWNKVLGIGIGVGRLVVELGIWDSGFGLRIVIGVLELDMGIGCLGILGLGFGIGDCYWGWGFKHQSMSSV